MQHLAPDNEMQCVTRTAATAKMGSRSVNTPPRMSRLATSARLRSISLKALACCHSWLDACRFGCSPDERSGRCWPAAPCAVVGTCGRGELSEGAGALSVAAASCGLAASLTDAAAGWAPVLPSMAPPLARWLCCADSSAAALVRMNTSSNDGVETPQCTSPKRLPEQVYCAFLHCNDDATPDGASSLSRTVAVVH